MAEVWKARDLRLDRTVVAKFLRIAERGAPAARRFKREARILAGIDDRRVVRVHDVDEAEIDGERYLYIITQYVEGDTLRTVLPAGEALSVARALHLATELCEALTPVHDSGLVHRDVKPGNVMVRHARCGGVARAGSTDLGGEEQLVLLDFGIARAYTAAGGLGGAGRITGTAQLMGTPGYMAPERFLLEPEGPAADVYSVGCVLFEMLTGSRPYVGDDYGELARSHCHGRVPSARAVRSELPAALEELLLLLLAKRAGDRPADAREVARALRELRAAPPRTRRPPPDPVGRLEARLDAVLAAEHTPAERARLLTEIADTARETLPADHVGGWYLMLRLARALRAASAPAAAAERLAPVAARAREVYGPSHRLTLACAVNLARYLGEAGHPMTAAGHLAETRTAVADTLPPTDPWLSEVRFDLAHWLETAGETGRAGLEYRALYEDYCRTYGPDAPETSRLYELIDRATSEE
ncbi:serine/threonine-protein kinase [Streptomyces alkaliterrae]|uniref:non-specific serine/threonine protein kinase n=1 Tax=Streptomyces alkaliterrae TaxID=2213162 RepID=A0A7W3WUA9_9ACTN|nr:serine/threonine-protein kinase [Streptomyces alkaliterrae]MBB1258561.1 serine/threonine protein kinase [Streptomyces alkaliterrae]